MARNKYPFFTSEHILANSELGVIDDVTAGTVAASKALVVSSDKELTSLGKITFASLKTDTGAGNYGATLNSGWLELDPGSGGTFGAKLMFSNADASGYKLQGLGLRCRANETAAIAIGLDVSASANHADSGQCIGGQFYLQNSSTYTIAGAYESTALYAKSVLAAACAPIASALWVDDGSTTKATVQHMIDITMNGTVEIDNVFHIYGGEPGADTFIDFQQCNIGSGAFLSLDATDGADLTSSYKIKCKVTDDGGNVTATGYMHLFTS